MSPTTLTPKFNDRFAGHDYLITEIDGITYIAEKVWDDDYQLTDDDLDTMTARDYIAWESGELGFIKIVIRAGIGIGIEKWIDEGFGVPGHVASYYGIRSDEDDDYLEQLADDLLPEAIAEATALLPTHVTGQQAIANGACSEGMSYVLNTYMQCTGRIPSLTTPIPIRCIDDDNFRIFAVDSAWHFGDGHGS